MNKQDYLRLLKQQMSTMDVDTSMEIMTHVLRVFEDESAKGRADREIVQLLGNPSKLIANYPRSPLGENFIHENEETVEAKTETDYVDDDVSIKTVEPVITVGNTGNTNALLRFLLGLLIGLPLLLVLGAIVFAGIGIAVFAFLQGLIMTFDLPYRLWQLPFTIREDFSLLVGIGLIMVGSGLITLFASALRGIYHGFRNLFKGNFRSFQ